MKNYIKLAILFFTIGLVSCESLEDTYSDFSDGGRTRYLGKCKDVTTTRGWKRVK